MSSIRFWKHLLIQRHWVKPRLSLRAREALTAMAFLLPNILGFLVFTVFTVTFSIGLSFSEWDMFSSPTFVGLENFYRLIFEDKLFRQSFLQTAYYTLGSVPLAMLLGLTLALLMNQTVRGIALFRTIYFLPVVTSSVAVALIWGWLYHSDFGLFNYILNLIGLPAIPWLTSRRWAMPSVILLTVWKGFGGSMIYYLAGLQSIPESLYDAAKLDGAGTWQLFRHITLPLLSPTTFFVAVLSVIGSFQVFDIVLMLTGGGPAEATNTLVLFIYREGFLYYNMGYASAASWILFGAIFIFTWIQMRYQRQWVHYD